MKRILIILFCLFSLSFGSVFSENIFTQDIIKVTEHVNSQHPLMIGDVIYKTKLAINDDSFGYYNLKLRYIGSNSSQIKIRYEFSKDVPDNHGKIHEDVSTLLMPLDQEEKTYIKIHQLPRLPQNAIVPAKTLVVSVYDRDRNLITVEEFGKFKTFREKESGIEK